MLLPTTGLADGAAKKCDVVLSRKGNEPAVKMTRSLTAVVLSHSLSRHQTVARYKHGRGDTSEWRLDSSTSKPGGSFAYLHHRDGRAVLRALLAPALHPSTSVQVDASRFLKRFVESCKRRNVTNHVSVINEPLSNTRSITLLCLFLQQSAFVLATVICELQKQILGCLSHF